MSVLGKVAAKIGVRPSHVEIGPIGVDFGLESIHLVQLAKTAGEAPVVQAKTSLSYNCERREVLANPLLFRSLIKRALDAGQFHGRKAVMAIPSGMFRTISVNYQSNGDPAQDGAAILQVMKDRLDGELSDYVIDYLPVKSRSKNNEKLALVAVSEHKPIVELLELARKARLNVSALEIGPVAISRLIGTLAIENPTDNVLVINSGRQASYLTVISGTDLLFDQQVAFGENSLIEQIAATLDLSEKMARDLIIRSGIEPASNGQAGFAQRDDAGLNSTISQILKPQFLRLAEEVKRVCLYAASETRGGAISRVYLLGSIARWPGSDLLLSSLANVSVEKNPDPLRLLTCDTKTAGNNDDTSSPDLVVATGAALRGMCSNG